MAEKHHPETTRELREKARQAERINHGHSLTTPTAPIVRQVIRRYRGRLFQLYLMATALAFAALFFMARHFAYFRIDLSVSRWVQDWHTEWLDLTMQGVSQLGYNPMAWIFVLLTILFVFASGLRWESVSLLCTSLGIGFLGTGVKAVARRERPTADLVNILSAEQDYSFPSGHVLFYTAFLGFLFFLIYTLMLRGWARTCGLIFLGTLVAMVGLSRIYLGVHWASDVVGAYLLGTLWLATMIFIYRKGKKHFFAHQPIAPGEPPTPIENATLIEDGRRGG